MRSIRKVRFIEPGNSSPYRRSLRNLFTYNKFIRNPSTGLITLATLVRREVADTRMYSESISEIDWEDVIDADILFVGINTFNAVRGYRLARELRARSRALLVFGGMHASLNSKEAIEHCDYVLTGDADESILEFLRAIREERSPDFPGVLFKRAGEVVDTGPRDPPEDIDTIPDRHLVVGYARMASTHDTLWPQVHASRGCPHSCDYCAVIRHFGQRIRKRSPEKVVEDIRQAIAFHERRPIPRLNRVVWITDDNFAQDRAWALSVLDAILQSGLKGYFSVQARYEIGFDDELLDRMKQAGFLEVALGIEFLDDASFQAYHKRCTHDDVVRAIRNIRRHGIGVRGLFIVGADAHSKGIGDRIADFVIESDIHGALVQSLFFTPGTPFFEANKERLIHQDWDRYNGNVVHFPQRLTPHELQEEIIRASARIYSPGRLVHALATRPLMGKVLFFGEFFWQRSLREELASELPFLKSVGRGAEVG